MYIPSYVETVKSVATLFGLFDTERKKGWKMEAIKMGMFLCNKSQLWLSRIKLSSSAALTYQHILACARGREYAWPDILYSTF